MEPHRLLRRAVEQLYVLVSDAPFNSTDLTATINQAGVSNYYMRIR